MRRTTLSLLLVVLLGMLWSTAAAEPAVEQWTRFRGPNGAGQSDATTIPVTWTEKDYNWTVELPGRGHSSPVHWGKRIFLTGAANDGKTRLAFCLDSADGKLLWQQDFPSNTHHVHPQNSFASSSAAVDADHVYVIWTTPEAYTVHALTHEGKPVWHYNLGPFKSQHGFGTSPIVVGEMVVVNDDQDGESSLVALDRHSGKVSWRVPRQAAVASYTTPCIYETKGSGPQLIFHSQAHGMTSIDPATGATNWELGVFERRSVSSPIIAGGLIFGTCGEGSGANSVVAVRPGSKGGQKPEIAYKLDKSVSPYVPTLVAHGEHVFLWSDKGVATCIEAATGHVIWKERTGGVFSGSPIRVGDRLYCISTEGEVVALNAGTEFKVLGRMPLGELSRSTPSVDDGRMYLRTESHLFSVGGKKG